MTVEGGQSVCEIIETLDGPRFVKTFSCRRCRNQLWLGNCSLCRRVFLREREAFERLKSGGSADEYVVCPDMMSMTTLTMYFPKGEMDMFQYVIDYGQKLEWSTRARLLHEIARALTYCHEVANLVHLDLKLENTLLVTVEQQLCARLIDFGYAVSIRRTRWGRNIGVGTSAYAAPEAPWRKPKVDEESVSVDLTKLDVWAFGVMAFILAFGYNPWQDRRAQGNAEWRLSVVGQMIELPDWYTELLDMTLVADPSGRKSATQVCEHLGVLVVES